MSLEATLHPTVIPGFILTSSSVLLSLLSLGLPGQQQRPQVTSLLPLSALSALCPPCALCAHSRGAPGQWQPLPVPSKLSPFTETQALLK